MTEVKEKEKKLIIKNVQFLIMGAFVGILIILLGVVAQEYLNLNFNINDVSIQILIIGSYYTSIISASYKIGDSLKNSEDLKTKLFLAGFFSIIFFLGIIYFINIYEDNLKWIIPITGIMIYIVIPWMILTDLFANPKWNIYHSILNRFSTYGAWILFTITLITNYIILPVISYQIPPTILIISLSLIWFFVGMYLFYLIGKSSKKVRRWNDPNQNYGYWIIIIILILIIIGGFFGEAIIGYITNYFSI